jgi:Flp pilus assembly protein TadD
MATEGPAVTFTKDIAPIIFRRCSLCHRPGAVGPFSLLTYEDVRRRARQIVEVTSRRLMPPWPPEPGYGDFADERRLTDEEIELIRRWVDSGALEGDPKDLPPRPAWPEGWVLGQPDLVVRMSEPYVVPADGPDIFRKFVLPIPVKGTRYVRAVEFRPDNARVVHHAIMHLDRSGLMRLLDQADPEPGFGGMIFTEGEPPEGHFLGWSPGRMPTVPGDDLAWRLEEGTDLILQLHLQPTGKPEPIQASVGFFFTNTPPTRRALGLQLSSYDIDIPPGDRHHVVEDRYTVPVDVEVLAIYPHAHYLGKEVQVFATLPDGTTRWLIWIKQWDFYWQGEYRYRQPVVLPAGSTIVSRYIYDNSADNPRNPHRPPRRVRYGGESSDEMANTWMQVVPKDQRDFPRLQEDYGRKATERYVAGYRRMIERDPNDAAAHRGLGFAYLRLGELPQAIVHLERALQIGPDDALTRYNLGTAYASVGMSPHAIAQFRRAIEVQPDFAEAYNNLGVLVQAQGDLAEATRLYRRAVELYPDYPEAHNNLGVMLQAQGQIDEAIAHFRRAVELRPDYALARSNLEAALAARDKRK